LEPRPQVLPALLGRHGDLADDDVRAVRAGGEAVGDLPIVGAALGAGRAQEQALPGRAARLHNAKDRVVETSTLKAALLTLPVRLNSVPR